MSPLEITVVPVTPFEQNASIVVCAATKTGVLVDPGGDPDRLMAGIEKSGAAIERILLTHGHIDHAGAAAELAERLAVPITGPHRADAFLLEGLPDQAAMFGLAGVRAVTPDAWLAEGETVAVGDVTFRVAETPGHTPGHVVFISDLGLVIGGDVLFAGSVGRTDFPYSDPPALIRAIEEKLMPLSDDVTVLPGHGPATTIGRERQTNPFLRR